MPISAQYHFRQRFVVPSQKAYNWSTYYHPRDHKLMGMDNAARKVKRIAENTVILTDVFRTENGTVKKMKLVQLYPDRLSWISTHLTGPNKYSQFIYEISDEGPTASHLDFTGLHLEYLKEHMEESELKMFTEKLCMDDAEVWKQLAKAMEKELGKKD